MPCTQHNWHLSALSKVVSSICIALALCLCNGASSAWASSVSPSDNQISLRINVGLSAQARMGYWLPVWVTVNNPGRQDVNGIISLKIYSGLYRPTANDIASRQRFEQSISIPHGQSRQVVLHIPFNVGAFNIHGVLAELLDQHGKVLAFQEHRIDTIGSVQTSVGVLSDDNTTLNYLSNVTLSNQVSSIQLTHLNAQTMPALSSELENFDVIILDNFTTSSLSAVQRSALQTWINQGGALIAVGGPNWRHTLSPLPSDLLPVDVYTTIDLAPGTPMLSAGSLAAPLPGQQSPPSTLNAPLQVSFATLAARGEKNLGSALRGNVVLASGVTPLIVTAKQGQGTICYLAFDPATAPFPLWPGTNALWLQILLRTLGDQLLISPLAPKSYSGPGNVNIRGGILSILQNNIWTMPWILVLLLLAYVAILGPVRLLIVQKLRRPFWNWRIMLSSMLVFSLLSYGVAFYQKGSSLTDNSISIVQINQNNSNVSITTYMGIFVPNEGDFHVRLPAGTLAQVIPLPLISSNAFMISGDPSTPVTYEAHATNVALLDSGPWTFHPLVAQQDRQLNGAISTHLTIRNNRLIGTIKNTLAPLSDVYILLPHGFVAIGTLPAGETQKIDLALQMPRDPDTSLADQLAQSSGLPASYFPYERGDQPQTDFQRHMALLAALNGNGSSLPPCGGPCRGNAIVNLSKQNITSLRPGLPSIPWNSTDDPLLLDGTPATLIGWADQPLDNMQTTTVNGTVPTGFHESFVQMPLNIALDVTPKLSSDLIQGQVIASTGFNNEMVLPGVYMMELGSMNFAFDLSALDTSHIKGLTISVPNIDDNQIAFQDFSSLRTALYNWQTGTWDQIPLNNYYTLASNHSRLREYIGPDSQVLLQVTNPDAAPSHNGILFKRPALSFEL
ncbi:hypothetical protein KSF_050280 [Reticulibacter mediterranei]|uniref:Uncharacterized protein n=1 Tax=Reticulibacter mediterranei TaxID=2778369 RepID=A0A8J3IQF9_9CHLR|nr:hypothetical protein [Reticulibacter mediterranei]GHO94980.1 hypothetical protein KSF_050280 [Reticulibacter mediterranei]